VRDLRHVGEALAARARRGDRDELVALAAELEHRDLRARSLGGSADDAGNLLLRPLRGDELPQWIRLAIGVGREALELLAHQLVLEPGRHVEVDDRDRPGDDQGEDQRQAVAERPQRPRHRHSPSVSRKR
jgi:hypothetical protein